MKKANELEKKYEWFQAAKFYKKASEILLKEKDFVNAAELAECLGYCFYRAAFQAENYEKFKKQILTSEEECKSAIDFFQLVTCWC